MRPYLDGLYRLCGILAGVFLVLIGVLILAQILGRTFGFLVPSADDFAGFAMAASAFLGLAHTLRAGAHIRVNLLLGQLPSALRRPAELFCIVGGGLLVAYFTWFSLDMTLESWEFGDKSAGLIAVPLWIPQGVMTTGLVVLAIAFLDEFVHVLRGGVPSYETATETVLEADRLGDVLDSPGSR